jgi:hypothetical protein
MSRPFGGKFIEFISPGCEVMYERCMCVCCRSDIVRGVQRAEDELATPRKWAASMLLSAADASTPPLPAPLMAPGTGPAQGAVQQAAGQGMGVGQPRGAPPPATAQVVQATQWAVGKLPPGQLVATGNGYNVYTAGNEPAGFEIFCMLPGISIEDVSGTACLEPGGPCAACTAFACIWMQ